MAVYSTPWLRLGLRLIAAYAILSVAAVVWGRYYVELLLPLYHTVLAALGPEYLVGPLSIVPLATGEPVISSVVTVRQAFLLGSGVVPAGLPMTVSTLVGHALQHPTLLFAVGLAWPLTSMAQRVIQIILLVVALVIVECLDVPLVLLGSVHDLLYANIAVPGATPSWLVGWMNGMNGGGRLALSVAGSVLASIAAARFRSASNIATHA